MKFKNLMFVVSFFFLLALPFAASADSWLCYRSYHTNRNFPLSNTFTFEGSADEAFRQAVLYTPFFKNTSSTAYINYIVGNWGAISNITTGVYYDEGRNPYRLYYIKYLYAFSMFCLQNNIDIVSFFDASDYILRDSNYYFKHFVADEFITRLYQRLTSDQLLKINMQLSTLQTISSDVSALVPALESHASNVSNLSQIVSSTFAISTNLQHDIYNEVSGINYVINSSAGLSAINDKLSLLDPSLASSYVLCGAFADVMGMSGYPHQALISAGLATDFQDAENKISDQNWAHTVLAPVFNSQKRKNAYIQQFQKDGITPPAGKTWDQLSENELETIANYSYNTPVSSNATLNAHALDYLKHIKASNDSIDSSVNDIRQHIQGGPLEVNVMNWPDDIFGAANISNMFNDLISNFEASLTNFNPHYTWEDALFFDRSQYSWRGLNTLDFDPRHDPNSSPIGVSTFNFTPSGNYFQDVPNFLALQSRISVDIANMIATVTAYSQTNLADRASTADLEQQYQEEFLQQSAEALNEFEQAQSYSNLFARNARFIDTSSVFSTPSGFTEIFSGNHSIPTHINLQLPSWHFGQDDQSTPDVGSTITIETAQYATFFQNCRYVFLFLYWGITVMIMIWLFRLFTRFISWIPLSLTGGGSHDTVSI